MASHVQQNDVVHVCDGLPCGRKERKRNEEQEEERLPQHLLPFTVVVRASRSSKVVEMLI
jgi:hypothetical protein